MVYKINVNFSANERDEPWTDEIVSDLESFGYELKVAFNNFYEVPDLMFEVYGIMPDIARDYNHLLNTSKELYTTLLDNILRRFSVYCELKNLHINILIKRNGQPFKEFSWNHINTIRSLVRL